MNKAYVKNLYWEDVVVNLLELVKDEDVLRDYYGAFKTKYIDVLR